MSNWNTVILYGDDTCTAVEGRRELEYLRQSLIEANGKISALQTALDNAAEDYAALMLDHEDALLQIGIMQCWKDLARRYKALVEKMKAAKS